MYPFKLGRDAFPAWADIDGSGHVSDVVSVAETLAETHQRRIVTTDAS